jgi:hypothetical protein
MDLMRNADSTQELWSAVWKEIETLKKNKKEMLETTNLLA